MYYWKHGWAYGNEACHKVFVKELRYRQRRFFDTSCWSVFEKGWLSLLKWFLLQINLDHKRKGAKVLASVLATCAIIVLEKESQKTSFWHFLKLKKLPKLRIGGRGNLSNAQKGNFSGIPSLTLPFSLTLPLMHLSFIWQISAFDGIKKKTNIKAIKVIQILKTSLDDADHQ